MPKLNKDGLSDNAIAAIAYFTPVMAVFFLAIRRYNKRPFVRFHAWQSLLFNVVAISVGSILTYVLPYIRFVGPRVLVCILCTTLLAGFLIWLWCVFGAASGRRTKLPVIGQWSDEQAYR